MTKSQFRWLLVAYLVLVIIDFVTEGATSSMIPNSVAEAHRNLLHAQFAPHNISALTLVIGFGMVAVIVAALVGIAGMFCFWKPGLYAFLAAVLARIVASPILFPWDVQTGWNALVGDIGTMLEGIIFTLVFFGPAKPLFYRERSLTTRPNEVPSTSTVGSRSPCNWYAMKRNHFAWWLWAAGTVLIVLSWMKVVSTTVGWCGFAIGLVGSIISWGLSPPQSEIQPEPPKPEKRDSDHVA